jgi:hypothetical protein
VVKKPESKKKDVNLKRLEIKTPVHTSRSFFVPKDELGKHPKALIFCQSFQHLTLIPAENGVLLVLKNNYEVNKNPSIR